MHTPVNKKIICLMGPTASGKTAIACELVKRFPLEIISVDSAMIYQGMDIGTAKPDLDTLSYAPHHLIDICKPDEVYSVAAFCEDTTRLCDTIFERGHVPLLVGGTMMYFRALQTGLSLLPQADLSVRASLGIDASRFGWPHMHALLVDVDREAALRIHPHDAQRIMRALEVYRITQKPLSAHIAEQKQGIPYPTLNLSLFPLRRAWLHDRIALRFDDMLAQGFLQEVEGLIQLYSSIDTLPSMRTVGYRQALDYFHGLVDHSSFRERSVAATRQLAKRQLTWLRSWTDSVMIDPEQADATDIITNKISCFLTT